MIAAAPYLFCILLSGMVFVLWRRLGALQGAALARAAAEAKYEQLLSDVEALRTALAAAQGKVSEAEKQEALAQQKVDTANARMKEFDELKKQFELQSAAALRKATSELIEDSRKERVEAQKQYEQFAKTATEPLMQRYQELVESMGKVRGQVDVSAAQVNVLVRAMKNPIGAGAEGEIALDNLLQQLGLTPGQDYDLQVHLAGEGGSLRPDGVIYLPNEQALVIDAKASQHIFALYEADGTPEFDSVFERVGASMKQHARALAGKAYADEVTRWLKGKGKTGSRVMLLMFVPNDEVITRLRRKDPELIEMMNRSNIILAGPSTLPAVFMYASTLIREARQQDEQHVIMELVQALMGDLITAMSHAQKVINGIGSSAKSFDAFAASMNSGVLSRLRKLYDKGLRPTKNRTIPSNLPRYEVNKADDTLTVEAESVEVLSLTQEDAA